MWRTPPGGQQDLARLNHQGRWQTQSSERGFEVNFQQRCTKAGNGGFGCGYLIPAGFWSLSPPLSTRLLPSCLLVFDVASAGSWLGLARCRFCIGGSTEIGRCELPLLPPSYQVILLSAPAPGSFSNPAHPSSPYVVPALWSKTWFERKMGLWCGML